MYEATKSFDALDHLSAPQRGQSDTNRHQQVCAKHRQQTSHNKVYSITTFFTKCPGQIHPPGSPPPGSFHRVLSLLFFTGTSCMTSLTGLLMLIVWLVLSEIRSNPEKQHKWAKSFHLGQSNWTFSVSTQAPRTTLLSHLLTTVGALTSPVSHHCFPLAWIFILHFLCHFFPQHRPFQRDIPQKSLSVAQQQVSAEGERGHMAAGALPGVDWVLLPAARSKIQPKPKAGRTDWLHFSSCVSWPLKTRPYQLFVRK